MTNQEAIKYLQQIYPNGGHCWLDEQRMEAIGMAVKSLQEEPASEDLEEVSKRYALNNTPWDDCADEMQDAFKAGAKWQKEQFEKNRLAHCDAQTEKDAQIEQDFVTDIIDKEHRQPTFDDAIKYGIRLKEQQMMANAVEGVVHHFEKCKVASVHYNDPTGVPMAYFTSPEGLSAGDKVKIIVIKEG